MGGISAQNSRLEVSDSRISDNVSRGWGGGGVRLYETTATFRSCRITGNTCDGEGAGIEGFDLLGLLEGR
jgi:hypothetical protein